MGKNCLATYRWNTSLSRHPTRRTPIWLLRRRKGRPRQRWSHSHHHPLIRLQIYLQGERIFINTEGGSEISMSV